MIEVPRAISLRVSENDSVSRLIVAPLAVKQEDRQRLALEFFPLDSDDLPADEPGIVVAFDWSGYTHRQFFPNASPTWLSSKACRDSVLFGSSAKEFSFNASVKQL